MLNENDLLPEEQTNPDLIQELRATYRLRPEEQQALARVHERLAHGMRPLPQLQTVQLDELTRPAQRIASARPPARVAGFRQRWVARFSTLTAAMLVVILVASLVLTFSLFHQSGAGLSGGSAFGLILAPVAGSNPARAEMQFASEILAQRFNDFGLSRASVSLVTFDGQLALRVELPHFGGNEQATVGTLVQTGKLEFWSTGPSAVPLGQSFDPAYYSQYNPGNKPWFTGKDIDPSQVGVNKDQAGRPTVIFALKDSAASRFGSFTARYLGEYLTLTFDRKVIESAVIQAVITNLGGIAGNFTQQQANAIAADLKAGSLPVALSVVG